MLVIRNEQLAVFAGTEEARYERRLTDYLADEYPGEAERLGEEGILALIRRARSAGRQYAIETTGAVAVWVELWLLFGDNLRRSPDRLWAEQILRHKTLPDYIRVDQVRERLTSRTGGRVVVAAGNPKGAA